MRCSVSRKDRFGHVHPCLHPAEVFYDGTDARFVYCRQHDSREKRAWASKYGMQRAEAVA